MDRPKIINFSVSFNILQITGNVILHTSIEYLFHYDFLQYMLFPKKKSAEKLNIDLPLSNRYISLFYFFLLNFFYRNASPINLIFAPPLYDARQDMREIHRYRVDERSLASLFPQ